MYDRLDAAVVACEPPDNFALKGYDGGGMLYLVRPPDQEPTARIEPVFW